MSTIILPILDGRIVTKRNSDFPFFMLQKTEKNPESLINDFAEKEAITLHHTQQMMYEDHHYLLGYVKSLHTPLNRDLIREDTHIKTLPLPIQTAYYAKIQDDKKHYHFRFSETKPADLPTIQTFTFVVLQGTDLVAIVRDGGEEHFSLPGGTCELRETDAAGAKREVLEEAQITLDQLQFLGGNIVTLHKPNTDNPQQTFFQSRFLAFIAPEQVQDFVPFKDGYETEERKFVPLKELSNYIYRLGSENGQQLYKQVSKILYF